ncbi:PKD domain-containing protein [Halorarius litoreus]|uniref:PKD domain-containing protein n=1 Tax=Halorarius litoreus TaxID=2962676 RepID=UPI0020CCA968|nr:PKD domain-containing protein [Halorarius litoreus]
MDTRGQPVQVGVIILFGFLIIAFSLFQAVIVPQQNAEVEFQHSQVVTNDMQLLRNDIVEAGATGDPRTASVKLGTTYPPRIFAVNPSPASGSLRSVSVGTGELSLDAPGADIESICGYDETDDDGAVPTKSLVYEPNYNVYQRGQTVHYENSVVFREEGGTEVLDSGQTIIKGKQITLPAFLSTYQRDGTDMAVVDITAGKTGIGSTNASDETNLTVPTQLSVTKWEELLANEGQVEAVTANGDGTVTITLEPAAYEISCPVVGAGTAPTNQPTRVAGQGGDINPSGADDVRLSDVERDPDTKDIIVLTFTNPGDDVNLSEVRFNFYQAGSNDGPSQMDIFEYDRANTTIGAREVDNLQLRGAPAEPSSNVTFTGSGATTSLAVAFNNSDDSLYSPSQSDMAVLNILLTDGQEANYFVNMPKQGTTVSNDPPTAAFTATSIALNTADFDASGSSDPEGSSLTYDWDWTSDGSYEGSGETPSHTYGSSGTYNVTLRVTDDEGATDTVTKAVEVGAAGGGGTGDPPSVTIDSATASNIGSNGKTGDIDVTFTASDPDNDISSYTVTLYNSSSKTTQLDAASGSFSGGQTTVSVSDSTTAKGSGSDPWYVVVEITDANNNTGSNETQTS